MRYAVISDIHGNLEALEAVLDDIDSRTIDVIICLGDIVGYYPDPEACVELIRRRVAYSVAGNHDFAAVGLMNIEHFTYYALRAIEWTKENLSEKSKEYLKTLPLTIQLDGLFFTHSSPAQPKNFVYIFPNSEKAIVEAFSSLVHKLNFIGHSHWPFILKQDDRSITRCMEDIVTVTPGNYYLINVGSVGQPRNFNPCSSYMIYDTDESTLSSIFVRYDYTVTQQKVIANNLPQFLAERLADGR